MDLHQGVAMDLHDRVALVTGGAGGIGLALAHSLLKRGAKVTIVDNNKDAGVKALAELQEQHGADHVIFVSCDVTDRASFVTAFDETVSRFGDIDLVFNNAGINNEQAWEKMIQINMTGAILGTKIAFDLMSKTNGRKGGQVINTASIAGLVAYGWNPVYRATKAGVVMFTRCMCDDIIYKKHGIRVNAICPSFVDTTLATVTLEPEHGPYAEKLMEGHTWIPASVVAEYAMELLQDEEKNGAIMLIQGEGKMNYVQFEDIPLS